jgi:hypothetical protein
MAPVERVWFHKWKDYGRPRDTECFNTCFPVYYQAGLRWSVLQILRHVTKYPSSTEEDAFIREEAAL